MPPFAMSSSTADRGNATRNTATQLAFDDRGLLTFSQNDPEDPKNFAFGRKCYITAVAISLVINATFASSAPSGTFQGISSEFGISLEAAGLVTTLFLLGYVAGPLFWAPLSEFYGRIWIFRGSFTLYLAFGFLCAFTPTFGGLLIGRFLTGTSASAALTNAPGVLSDVWGSKGRGNAMILFATMTFVGPALGPVVAGFLQLKEDWRWIFYVLLWMAAGSEVLLLTIGETLPSTILARRACRRRKLKGQGDIRAPTETSERTLSGVFAIALIRPWKLLFDPISFFVALYYAVVYTLLYMLFSIYPIVFQQHRGWNAGVGELPLIGTVIGACLGGTVMSIESYISKKKDIRTKSMPEDRLPWAMVGGVMFPATIFWFSWTAEFNSIDWAVPTVAGVFLAMSILLIFVAFINYIIDTYLKFAASAVAANTILRSACAAASPLFTNYMFDTMGVGGAGSLIGGIGLLLLPIPFVFYRYGAKIRARSSYATSESDVNSVKREPDSA